MSFFILIVNFLIFILRRFVKPSYDEFCAPTKKYADIIVPRGVENDVAINLIICHIQVLNKNLNVGFSVEKIFIS